MFSLHVSRVITLEATINIVLTDFLQGMQRLIAVIVKPAWVISPQCKTREQVNNIDAVSSVAATRLLQFTIIISDLTVDI